MSTSRKKKNFQSYGKSNKELNALIEKNLKISQEQEMKENREGATTLS